MHFRYNFKKDTMMLLYKGYRGSVEFDKENNIYEGKLLYEKNLVTYEADSFVELISAFVESVDEYVIDLYQTCLVNQQQEST